MDARREKVNFKIREAQLQKVPYMLIVGYKEIASGAAALRSRSEGDLGPKPLDEIIQLLVRQVAEKE